MKRLTIAIIFLCVVSIVGNAAERTEAEPPTISWHDQTELTWEVNESGAISIEIPKSQVSFAPDLLRVIADQLEAQNKLELLKQQARDQIIKNQRRQPTFSKIGPNSSSGGSSAIRQRSHSARVNLLDSDPNMKVLADRYDVYMKKLAEQLQQSLNREVMMNPVRYTRGQAKIYFSLTAAGQLDFYDTQYPKSGMYDYVRITSEQTIINAGPFDKPTKQMIDDPLFKRMSLTVDLF